MDPSHAKISAHATHITHAKILWTHATHATHAPTLPTLFKVAYRGQIWKKAFCQNSDKFGDSVI